MNKMELQITFRLDQQYLPKDYWTTFYSFLKTTLSEKNKEKYEDLFGKKDAKVKSFCFYVKLSNPTFEKDKVLIDSNMVTMCLRDYDEYELFEIYNAFLEEYDQRNVYKMNLNQAKIIDIKIKNLKNVNHNNTSMTWFVKMLSPLVVKKQVNKEENKVWYYSCEDKEFIKVLKENIKNTTERLGCHFNFENFELIPVNLKKTVINMYSISFPVTVGSFILKGDTNLLEFLYTAGIGVLRSSGCGAFELLGSESK